MTEMTDGEDAAVQDHERAYAHRAAEYVSLLGSLDQMDPQDVCLIGTWSDAVEGSVLDAGCGPGHWTDFLRARGVDVHGVDLVRPFVESARSRFPLTSFGVGDVLDLPFEDSSFGGVLAWYSLIHCEPAEFVQALAELARVTTDDGHLLLGGFYGVHDESFDHAITRAFYRGEEELVALVEDAGFDVLTTHTRRSRSGTPRPHLAITARKRPSQG